MEKLLALVGMGVIVGGAYLFSTNKKDIQWTSVACAFIGQLVLAFLLIKTPLWKVVEWISNGVSWLIAHAVTGIDFVFGGLTDNFVLFLNSLLPIVFISGLVGLLFHFGILQKFIQIIGKCVAKVLKVDALVAVNGTANMFLGQSDSLFLTKDYLPNASDSVIFATLVGGMTSISVSVVGLYASYGAPMAWIIASMPLTVFSTFVLTQLLYPTTYEDVETIEISMEDKGANAIETMINYANTGFKAVIGIVIALITFLSLVSLINGLLGLINPSLSLESILSIPFIPVAYLMGVSGEEVRTVAEILSVKLVTNEAVAFSLPQFTMLSESAKAMMTVVNCGFAGFGSVGILIGAYSAIAPNKVGTVAKLGLKALVVATFVNILTGAVVGLFL